MEALIQQIYNGLSLAAIFIVVALGLQIIFGLMGIINLAHGEFMLIGAYTTFLLQSIGAPFLLTIVVAALVAIVLGYILEKSVIRYFYDKPMDTILVTWGISIMLRESNKLIFGPDQKPLITPISGGFEVGEFIFPFWRTMIIVICVILIALVHYLLNKSDIGLKIRATLENSDLSISMGVNVKKIYQITFLVGAVLAAFAGAIVIPLSAVSPEIGLTYLLPAFLVVIMGGFGSLRGLVLGGLFIGMLTSLLTMGMSSVTAEIVVFFIVVVALRFRPEGVFAKSTLINN